MKWMKIENGLPLEGVPVLIRVSLGQYRVVTWNGSEWWDMYCWLKYTPTHWTEIEEPK